MFVDRAIERVRARRYVVVDCLCAGIQIVHERFSVSKEILMLDYYNDDGK